MKRANGKHQERLRDIDNDTHSSVDPYRINEAGEIVDQAGTVRYPTKIKSAKAKRNWVAERNQQARFEASLKEFNEKYPPNN